MATSRVQQIRLSGICSCVPDQRFDNVNDTTSFTSEEVRKVTGMAGVAARRLATESTCSSDLCERAAAHLLEKLAWPRESVDALIFVSQTPDYFMPSTSCLLQHKLGLSDQCAAFDLGLGCSGYPYGLWLGAMMIQNGCARRVLLLHGETPARYAHSEDRAVALVFGDAGSATALEAGDDSRTGDWHFLLQTDGKGYDNLIIEGGGFRERFCDDPRKYYVKMNGDLVFNFTIRRVPELIQHTLQFAECALDDVDVFIFHQANKFIIKHLAGKLRIPREKAPIILGEFGNVGGPSLPLTITQAALTRPTDRPLKLMLLGYGTGWSWASALVDLPPDAVLDHVERRNRNDAK